MKKILCFVFALFFPIIINSQTIRVGDWDIHSNYAEISVMTSVGSKIYVGTKLGLFIYSGDDNSLSTFSKIDGLSSLYVSSLTHDQNNNSLLIGYSDGNIDILQNNTIINIPEIFLANIVGEKTINNIFIDNNLAYISCSFGLVVFNLEKREVEETCYFYGSNGAVSIVYQACVFDDDNYAPNDLFLSKKVFVATSSGLFYANKNANLLDYSVWSNDLEISILDDNNSDSSNFKLENTIVKHVVGVDLKESGGKKLIIGTDVDYLKTPSQKYYYNLFEYTTNSLSYFSPKDISGKILDINYNAEAEKFVITLNNNKLALMNVFLNITSSFEINSIENAKTNFSPELTTGIVLNNYSNSKEFLLGDARQGAILMKKNDDSLSFLELLCPNGPISNSVGAIGGNESSLFFTHGSKTTSWGNTYNNEEISFYNNGQWISSDTLRKMEIYDAISGCAANNNKFFIGTWNSGLLEFQNDQLLNHFYPGNTPEIEPINGTNGWSRIGGVDVDNDNNIWLTNSESNRPLVKFTTSTRSWTNFTIPSIATNVMCGQILCGNNGYKWIQLRNDGLVVVDDVGTSKKIGTGQGLASISVNCFDEDLDGAIWIGTSQGLSIVYSPEELFNNSNYNAEYILVENEDGNIERLFDNMEILDITVDPGNRKWIATKTNGVFLVSEDGTEQIYNFNRNNSPLLDNGVSKISILQSSGEVFFATGRGLCSYRSNSSQSQLNFNNVSVFPNPVKKDYDGLISITGLSNNTNVKITDISGNLVFETYSYGGTATWDGTRFNGEKVKTGVYLFLCTSENFTNNVVKKILIY